MICVFCPLVRRQHRLAGGFGLLELLLVMALSASLMGVLLRPLQVALGSRRLETDLLNVHSALIFAQSEALRSGHVVQLGGLHMRRNQTKNGVRTATLRHPNPWFQGILVYAHPPSAESGQYHRQEDLRDYSFLNSVTVTASAEHYQVLPSGEFARSRLPHFVLREHLSRRCATLEIKSTAPWPQVCRGRHCPGCAS
jgi:Tfp pilus assembly protein FimT